jgi:hypothetical protein
MTKLIVVFRNFAKAPKNETPVNMFSANYTQKTTYLIIVSVILPVERQQRIFEDIKR